MSTIAIIKLVSVLIGILAAGGGVLYLKNRLKKADAVISQNKILKKQKNSTIRIQRERQKIEKEKNETNEGINNSNSDKLADAYNEQLQNMPKPKRSRN